MHDFIPVILSVKAWEKLHGKNCMGETAWVKRKKKLARKYYYILVTGKNFKAFPTKDGYTVSFVQYYKFSDFSTQGRRQLKLVRQDGEWKIFRENRKGK